MQLKYSYWWFKSAISPENCQKILDCGNAKIQQELETGNSIDAITFGDSQKQDAPEGSTALNETPLSEINENQKTYVRDSKAVWLNEDWIYDLIVPFVHEANKKAGWNWQTDYHEMLQFTRYDSPGGFYGWHKDGPSDWNGVSKRYIHGVTQDPLKPNGRLPSGYVQDENMIGKIRKISMTINLNEPGSYAGGNLKFDFGMHSDKQHRFHECEEIRPQGSVIVFPSFVDHCVTPVTSGTRYSLVMWTLGDPWK